MPYKLKEDHAAQKRRYRKRQKAKLMEIQDYLSALSAAGIRVGSNN